MGSAPPLHRSFPLGTRSWGFPPAASSARGQIPRRLPWDFVPLRRRQLTESTYPGLASPGTFRLQAFATSWRLTPPSALRVYFAPLTPMGFALQSLLLTTSRTPCRTSFSLLALPSCCLSSPRYSWGAGAWVTSLGSGFPGPHGRLQGFSPAASSFMDGSRLSKPTSRCSPELSPL
jgi:hypothetical protein